LRKIDVVLDLSGLRGELAPFYSHTGRPSVDPDSTLFLQPSLSATAPACCFASLAVPRRTNVQREAIEGYPPRDQGRAVIFQKPHLCAKRCKSNIEMTPLCKIEMTLPRVLGSRGVHRGGGVDEKAGVQPARRYDITLSQGHPAVLRRANLVKLHEENRPQRPQTAWVCRIRTTGTTTLLAQPHPIRTTCARFSVAKFTRACTL
jgi:hypothetical protein